MKAWMAALIGGAPELVTVPFTSNQTWVAPVGVALLATLSGCGGAGSPAQSYFVDQYSRTVTVHQYFASTGQSTSTTFDPEYFSGLAPADYCDPEATLPNGNRTQNCYAFADASYQEDVPATTGPNASAFGYTFPGGAGGPAPTLTYGNVAVTPGNSYNIVVPSGGLVTITYYK